MPPKPDHDAPSAAALCPVARARESQPAAPRLGRHPCTTRSATRSRLQALPGWSEWPDFSSATRLTRKRRNSSPRVNGYL
jgi:hypothetical protein